MKDPLKKLYEKYGYKKGLIKRFVSGKRYTAVMLEDGSIGVCANLENGNLQSLPAPESFEEAGAVERIFLNAYYAALLNYNHNSLPEGDIFTDISFGKEDDIVMIGAFYPLIKKFDEAGIKLAVFDRVKDDDFIIQENKKNEYLENANKVIVTSTTISNGTWEELSENINEAAEVYLLGPSSILHEAIFELPQLKAIYGTVFENYDDKVINLIAEGCGTRTFAKRGKKVILRRHKI